ncbi:hypothetical protein Tco_0883221, partial [Tanacetum coccineum]
MPYPRFTKIIINHFLKQHKCLANLNHKHYHTIKDDGIVSRLKFVRIGEDYQEYGLPIPDVMLTNAIKNYDNDDFKKDENNGDADNEGDDHVSDTQDADDEDVKTKSDEDDIYKYKIRVHKDEDVEMKDAESASANLLELTKKPTPTTEQEYEKSPSDILKIKKEQAESQKNPQFTIKNPANHQLYHALTEALIEDENAMDKGVVDIVKDHKRNHDDDEDDDDEDHLAGPNQGKKTKRRRTKESESSKKPSTTKETPKGKTLTKGSKTGTSAPAKEPVEEPITEVIMDDAGDDVARDDNLPQDTSEPKTRKTLNQNWFKQPLRPPTPDPEWSKRQVVLDQPIQLWFNKMVFASKDPLTCNDLMATPIDFFKYVLNGLKIKNLTQDILLGSAFNKLDWNNPEGDRYPFDLSKPLPLQGPPGHRTIAADYFFNNELKYLKKSNLEVTYTTSIMKTKVARYEIKRIEDMV